MREILDLIFQLRLWFTLNIQFSINGIIIILIGSENRVKNKQQKNVVVVSGGVERLPQY